MSLTAAAIRALADKGLSASDIADIAEANQPLRSLGAVRQQRLRDKRRNGRDVTRDVTPSPNDIYSNPQPSPSVISDEITSPSPNPELASEDEPPLTPDEVLEAWNIRAAELGLPKAKMTEARRKVLRTRLRQHSTADFTEAIGALGRSAFLRGENDRGWRADFDFFLQPKSFTKLIEGGYDRAAH